MSTRVSTPSPFGNALIGVQGETSFCRSAIILLIVIRMGFARLAESSIRSIRGKGESDSLGALDKILAASIGGALATWNQPIEVVRVEVSIENLATASDSHNNLPRCNLWPRAPPTSIDLPS